MLVIVRELLAFKSSKIQTCSLQDFVNDRKTIFGRGSITNTTVQRNKYIILLYTTFNSLTFIFLRFLFSLRTRDIYSLKILTPRILEVLTKEQLRACYSHFPRNTLKRRNNIHKGNSLYYLSSNKNRDCID